MVDIFINGDFQGSRDVKKEKPIKMNKRKKKKNEKFCIIQLKKLAGLVF